jgi:hypothetical protein
MPHGNLGIGGPGFGVPDELQLGWHMCGVFKVRFHTGTPSQADNRAGFSIEG